MTKGMATFARSCLAALLSLGCAVHHHYAPDVYAITEGKIRPFQVEDGIDVVNAQEISDPEHVIGNVRRSYWHGDLKAITQALVEQLSGEIAKNGGRVASGEPKRMRVAVTDVDVTSAWTLEATLTVTLQLADRSVRTLTIVNRSPANIWRALNGAVATAVIEILEDEEVREFLAAPLPSAVTGARSLPPVQR
jgi:hypothetical protein